MSYELFIDLAEKKGLLIEVNDEGYIFFADKETVGNTLTGYININEQILVIQVPSTQIIYHIDEEFSNSKKLIDYLKHEQSLSRLYH